MKAFGADQRQTSAAREVMLSVRLESGDAWAFPYSYLVNISYERDANKLTVTFSSHRVIIHGERLHLLYEALLGHAAQFVQVRGEPIELRRRIDGAEHEITGEKPQPRVPALGIRRDPDDLFRRVWHDRIQA